MSVGGKVIEVVDTGEKVWVNTQDTSPEECAVYVARTPESRSISVGDSLWWQGRRAFWTPRSGSFRHDPPFIDKPLERVGFSGVARPTVKVEAGSGAPGGTVPR